MFMPTWLLGRRSVTTERLSGIEAEFYGRPELSSDQGQGTGGTLGEGHGEGTGLATTRPPGSGGTTIAGPVGVGLGGVSPGSVSIFVGSARDHLLFGPPTTPGGAVYHRVAGPPRR